RRIAEQVVDLLKQVRGTASASVFQAPPIPQLVVKVNREAAARYGINVADIANLVQNGVGGAPVISVYVEDRVYSVGVRFPA
ncbi:efflux RND transporter permease subunit, partial [Acinetobacter baumannii]